MLDPLTMTFIVINQFKITIRRLQHVRKHNLESGPKNLILF